MIIERLKFYADTPRGEKNKFFCWQIASIFNLEEKLIEFIQKGFEIRSAWYEKINDETGEILENSRINDLQSIFDKAIDQLQKKRLTHR